MRYDEDVDGIRKCTTRTWHSRSKTLGIDLAT